MWKRRSRPNGWPRLGEAATAECWPAQHARLHSGPDSERHRAGALQHVQWSTSQHDKWFRCSHAMRCGCQFSFAQQAGLCALELPLGRVSENVEPTRHFVRKRAVASKLVNAKPHDAATGDHVSRSVITAYVRRHARLAQKAAEMNRQSGYCCCAVEHRGRTVLPRGGRNRGRC